MFDKKKITAIILRRALIIVIIVILSFLFTGIFENKLTKIAVSVSEKKKAELILQKRNTVVATLRVNLNKIAPYESKIKNMVPPTENILKFTAALENLAKTYSLQQTLSFGTPSSPVQYGTILLSAVDYTVALTASAEQFSGYLKDFEKLPYLTSISAINAFSTGDWKNGGGATIKATLYAQATE